MWEETIAITGQHPGRSRDWPASTRRLHMSTHHAGAEYDWSVERPSAAVVETVAAVTNRRPEDLEPLYQTVDPDALDSLLRRDTAGSGDGEVSVSFAYAGQTVTVRRNGSVVTHRNGR